MEAIERIPVASRDLMVKKIPELPGLRFKVPCLSQLPIGGK